MRVAADPADARRLWHAAEAVHAVVYFAPETAQAAKDAGLKGFWMGYFAGRAAPMGAAGPAVVTAAFFNFHPAMVRRALPDAWAFATPAQVLRTRVAAVSRALARLLGGRDGVADAAKLATRAVDGLDCAGRPLAAAWSAWARDADRSDPLIALWAACTVLREHRGDGHVAALVDGELDGCQAHVLAAAAGLTPRESLQPHRGWADEDWRSAEDALRDRGLLDDAGALTGVGRALRERVEARTDELALAPLAALGTDGADRLLGALRPLAVAVRDGDAIPFPNPMGLPRPEDAL